MRHTSLRSSHHCRHFHNRPIQHTCTGSCLHVFDSYLRTTEHNFTLQRTRMHPWKHDRETLPVSVHVRRSRPSLFPGQVRQKPRPSWKSFFNGFNNTMTLCTIPQPQCCSLRTDLQVSNKATLPALPFSPKNLLELHILYTQSHSTAPRHFPACRPPKVFFHLHTAFNFSLLPSCVYNSFSSRCLLAVVHCVLLHLAL